MVMATFDSLVPMGSKSLNAEQNERARELVRVLLLERYENKKVTAAKAFGVSQPLLSGFLAGHKGLGAKLLNGIARRAPEVAAKILGGSGAEQGGAVPAIEASATPEVSTSAISPNTVEEAVGTLADDGYPYKRVRAALAGVAAYELAREPRGRPISTEETVRLAVGLLEQDELVPTRRSATSGADLRRAHARALRDAQQFPKRADGVGKRRAAK